ncbi:MAG: 23S rRNA (adenine(2030)-N(6))-methyltransferase RlmJ [Pseudomonadota bacterium]
MKTFSAEGRNLLSYQHIYHAGGPADVHKHLALAEVLALLTAKDRGVSYLETHAGRGLYHLDTEEALKTEEASEGINRVKTDQTGAYFSVLRAVRSAHGDQAYPGSPFVAASMLRPQDRIVLMEKHPQEVAALRRAMRGTRAEIHARDGYEGAVALSPMEPRRGLVLIDPSYEVKHEYHLAAKLVNTLTGRWKEAVTMVWYPLLRNAPHDAFFASLDVPVLRHEVGFDLKGGAGMVGSGLAIAAAPYGTDAALDLVMQQGHSILRSHQRRR